MADEPIYQGDVLEIQGDEGGRGWHACVEDIRCVSRAPRPARLVQRADQSSMIAAFRTHSAPRAQIGEDFTVTSVALLVSWFYSASDLRERKGDKCVPLGAPPSRTQAQL